MHSGGIMNNSKIAIRLLALTAYCLASVWMLWRLLGLALPVQHSPGPAPQPIIDHRARQEVEQSNPLPPRHPPARQLFRDRQQPPDHRRTKLLYRPEITKVINKFDEETLTASGFFLARPPTSTDNTNETLAYFDLARRDGLSRTDPLSIEAKIRRNNVAKLRFTFQGRAGKTSCRPGLDRILVVVMTTRLAVDRRQAIRQTWASEAESNGARVVFFLASSDDNNSTISATLVKEMLDFGDIVLVPEFLDTYRHLTLKMLSALQFACQLCPNVEMIAKVDDDSVLNLPALRRQWLEKNSQRFPGLQYVAGYLYRAPIVRRFGRWQVSTEDYPMPKFPDYMFGGTYVLRLDACRLFTAARLFPLLPVEDAFITGVLPVALGLHLAPENSGFACQYFNHAGSLNAAAFKRGLVMSATDLTPGRMRGFWHRYQQLFRSNETAVA